MSVKANSFRTKVSAAPTEDILEAFSKNSFKPKDYAVSYFKQHSRAEAREHCGNILDQKNAATLQLQRKIYQHYPNFIASANDISESRKELASVRQSIENIGENVTRLRNAANVLVKANSRYGTQTRVASFGGRMQQSISGLPTTESNPLNGFSSVLANENRFNTVVALSSGEMRWILEAPDTLDVLIYERRYKEAVDLIAQVREHEMKDSGYVKEKSGVSSRKSRCSEGDQKWALNRAKEKVNMRADEVKAILLRILSDGKSLSDSDHPVSLLQSLGEEQEGCDAFFRGQAEFINRGCRAIMASSLASDPERCVKEVARRVFRGILETVLIFRRTLMRNENGEHEIGSSRHLPKLVLWSHQVVQRFCSHFNRFALPEFRKSSENGNSINSGDVVQVIQVDSASLLGTAIKFGSEKVIKDKNGLEQVAISGLLLLNQEEWKILGACLKHTMLLCRRLEKEHLSLGFSVAKELYEPLRAAIKGAFRNLESKLRIELLKDNWKLTPLKVEGSTRPNAKDTNRRLSLTDSAFGLYDLMHEVMKRIKKILSPTYSTTSLLQEDVAYASHLTLLKYVQNVLHAAGAWPLGVELASTMESSSFWLATHLEDVVLSLVRRGNSTDTVISILTRDHLKRELTDLEKRTVTVLVLAPWTMNQRLAQIADVYFIISDLSKRVRQNLEKIFKRTESRLFLFQDEPSDQAEKYLHLICASYCKQKATYLLEDVLRWSHLDYSISAEGYISENFVRVGEKLLDLKNKTKKILGEEVAVKIVTLIVEVMLFKISSGWEVDEAARSKSVKQLFHVEKQEERSQLFKDIEYLRDQTKTLFEKKPSAKANEFAEFVLCCCGER
mmetsp:Transcript_14285/g.18746  ORF Transcript_14285/g.18746 Transcript_14285/m.18746 type:complete len:846 (+) Transcript_14285:288-2825(+)|eukprot:CAMPEP_0184009042 /NCGR_PEP_ID=MMETSP0954-20121128/2357_1 /TAXON_ID=627963 /ORGANISM="Aplanochytrium sp, Strain PBS07" /LENGTH=845 /DNA_ID=CAMNT_0026288315 /DNA_START=228 /DNA_END=2765 /DNA_ORIENTATION=+